MKSRAPSTLYSLWGAQGLKGEDEEVKNGIDEPADDSYIVKLKLPRKKQSNGDQKPPIHPFFKKQKIEREGPLSYRVTLKLSSDKLKSIADGQTNEVKRLTSLKTYQKNEDKPVHPFFLKKKKMAKVEDRSIQSDNDAKSDDSMKENSPSTHAVSDPSKPMHPFFAKRTRTPVAGRSKSVFSARVELDTPWPKIQHVRGIDAEEQLSIDSLNSRDEPPTESPIIQLSHSSDKGKRRKGAIQIGERESVLSKELLKNGGPRKVQKAKRMFMNPQQIVNLASESIDPKHRDILTYLLLSVGEPKAFDIQTCESQSWCMKYAPHEASDVVTGNNNALNLLEWMRQQIIAAKKARPLSTSLGKRSKVKDEKDLEDFIVDDEETEDGERANYLILHGPSGSAKTTAVYAAGEELNAYIFEINPSIKRSGKELLDILEGMVKSQLVHSNHRSKNQDSVILLEEVDVLFSDERSFWSGLDRLTEISRRPIILTCNDLNNIPRTVLEEKAEVLEFVPAPTNLQADALFLVALSEGHLLSINTLSHLVSNCNQDLRKALTILQFWCQMGIGSKKSGVEWFITSNEHKELDPIRVISKDEYIDTNYNPSSNELPNDPELLSSADILYNHIYSAFEQPYPDEADKTTSDYTSEMPLKTELLPFEEHYYLDLLNNNPTPEPDVPCNHCKYTQNLRDTLFFASYPLQGTGNLNSIDCVQGSTLTTEIAPFVRHMARSEIQHENSKTERLASLGEQLRSTRRSYAALGIDNHQRHLDCDDEDLNDAVKTAPLHWSRF